MTATLLRGTRSALECSALNQFAYTVVQPTPFVINAPTPRPAPPRAVVSFQVSAPLPGVNRPRSFAAAPLLALTAPAVSLSLAQVEVETRWGDSVVVVGSTPSLGSWDPQRGLRLRTDSSCYPRWQAPTGVPLGPEGAEYKLVILRGSDESPEWEPLDSNRVLTPATFAEDGRLLSVGAKWGSIDSERRSALTAAGSPVAIAPLPPSITTTATAAAAPAAPPTPPAAPQLVRFATPPDGSGHSPTSRSALRLNPPTLQPPLPPPPPCGTPLRGLPAPFALGSPLASRIGLETIVSQDLSWPPSVRDDPRPPFLPPVRAVHPPLSHRRPPCALALALSR